MKTNRPMNVYKISKEHTFSKNCNYLLFDFSNRQQKEICFSVPWIKKEVKIGYYHQTASNRVPQVPERLKIQS